MTLSEWRYSLHDHLLFLPSFDKSLVITWIQLCLNRSGYFDDVPDSLWAFCSEFSVQAEMHSGNFCQSAYLPSFYLIVVYRFRVLSEIRVVLPLAWFFRRPSLWSPVAEQNRTWHPTETLISSFFVFLTEMNGTFDVQVGSFVVDLSLMSRDCSCHVIMCNEWYRVGVTVVIFV